MRFSTIETATGQVWGLVEGDMIRLATPAILQDAPDLKSAIARGLPALAARLRAEAVPQPVAGLTHAAVIPNPAQIFCAGLNYVKHREETKKGDRVYPKFPVIFGRWATSLTGHGQPIIKPRNSNVVDYEGELVAIIGTPGRHIAKEDALAHVAGYACFNDVSMRDWQMRGEQWTPGKNFPTSGPLGPEMVTADEVGPLDDLWIRTILDGVEMQAAQLKDFIFDLPTLISYVSGFAELRPGDLIATGTPGGVGFTREPPVLLEPGKVCEVVVDRVGRLSNPVVAE